MPKPVLLLPFLFIVQLATSQQQPLFKITVKGKTGYINSSGAIVIPPIYQNGFDFKEGLAAVRENELYGFIDTNGKYVLAPQFDYATYFENGITLVYKKRQPYFINKTGKVVLSTAYQSIEFINDHKAVITTKSFKQGIIDLHSGRLLLDTIYSFIYSFKYGVAVIHKFHEEHGKNPGVIDTTPRFIVPPGKYENIDYFQNGYSNVTINSAKDIYGIIDVTGKLVSEKKTDTPCCNSVEQAGPDSLYLLDRHGRRVSNQYFRYIGDFFKNYAIAKTNAGYGIIDTNAQFIIPPQYKNVFYPDTTVDYFFFTNNDEEPYLWGMGNMKNEVIIPPVMQDIALKKFENDLLNVKVDGRKTWFNKQGRIVWQQSAEDAKAITPMNIEFASAVNDSTIFPPWSQHPANHDGFSSPLPKQITTADQFPQNKLFLKIDTSRIDTIANRYYANTLFAGNSTKDTMQIISLGGLAIKLEALDVDGAWRAIELFQVPRHMVDYNLTRLSPGTYWPFKIPRYEGSFRTKIRAVVWYEDKNQKPRKVYSNAINASINKTQFWRDYNYPQGVYDPKGLYKFDAPIELFRRYEKRNCK